MRAIFLAASAALALSACGGNDRDEAATLGEDNATVNADLNMTDINAVGGVDANGTVDANTQNAMMEDLTTNDADTNLANGM